MKNNNRKKKKKLLALSIIFILLLSYSPIFNNLFINPNLSAIQEENLTVDWGFNVYQNLPYWYSGTFYDDADFEFDWTTARIDFEYIPDNSITYTHAITDLDNSETQVPSNSSFQMVNGTHIQNGTLDVVDDDYHAFDSTYEKVIPEQPADFTITNGSSAYTGDLELLDGDYTTFESEKGVESEHYIANYTFTDDADGSNPAWWTATEPAGVTIEVVGEKSDHKKVVRILHDGTAVNGYLEQNVASQTSGTHEYWIYAVDASGFIMMQLRDASSQTIKMSLKADQWQYFDGAWLVVPNVPVPTDNTWHHVRVNFECSTGGYLGLAQYTFDFIVDGVHSGAIGFCADDDEINRVQFWAYSGNAIDCYLDAIDYSWNEEYTFGDNWYYDSYLGNQTFEQHNTTGDYENYYGTYNFNEDPVGTTSTSIGFIDVDTSDALCTATVMDYLDGHRRIIDFYDGTATGTVRMRHNLTSPRSYGTYEYWIRTTKEDSYNRVVFLDDGDEVVRVDLYWEPATNNIWYHYLVNFECTDGGYMGLAQYTYSYYCDGVYVNTVPFINNRDSVEQLSFTMGGGGTDYSMFFDAVGFSSWDDDYDVGDNINVYGGLRELQDDGWSFDFDFDVSARITGEDTSHRKILELYDNSGTYSVGANYSFSNQATGTYEAWFKSDLANKRVYIFIEDGTGSHAIKLRFGGNGQIQEDDGGGYADIQAYVADTWYHFRVEWDCADDWHLWIDDVSMDSGAGYDFYGTPTEMDKFHIYTEFTQNPITFSIDSLSFDWDNGYTIGDNQRVGDILDLIIEVNINLDSFSNLNELYVVYAYLTNISLTCNYSIYNFDDSAYDVIEYDINLDFVNSYFLLNSSYYNATNDLILSFEMMHYNAEFEMRLDRLLVRKPSYLNFSTSVNFDVLTGLLRMYINSYQRSNITQLINMSIWSYNTSSWVYLDGASYITTFQLLQWISTDFSDYINTNGDVLLMYNGVNIMDTFRFEIDALSFVIWRKTIVQYEKTLRLLGTWKYQFILDIGLGTEYVQDWVYFNVIEQQANFEGISESRYSTQWILTSTATSGELIEVYHRDLTSGTWYMTDYSDPYITENQNFYEDAHVDSGSPGTNYGQDWDMYIWSQSTAEKCRVYLDSPTPLSGGYLTSNTSIPNDKLYVVGQLDIGGSPNYPLDIYLWTTGHFDEDTITWNNKPAGVFHKDTQEADAYGVTFNTGYKNAEIMGWILIPKVTTGGDWYMKPRSYEISSTGTYLINYFTKFYHSAGSGYAYFQSDETETLGLASPVSSSVSLVAGDIITVDLQTTSDNAVLKLYSGGVLQTTLNLLTGNTEFGQQEVELFVSDDVTFDQIKIFSELTDTEYFKLYDIKAEHWVFDDEEDQRSMYVNPYGRNDLLTNTGNNSIKIYENDILRIDIYMMISHDLTTYVFESPILETVFVSFYDSNNEYLDFNKFTTYVNYTLYEENYIDQRLTSREFYVDEDSTIYFNVYDSFDVNIYSTSRLAKTFIDITLNIYSLKIKNEALERTDYTLTKGIVSKTGILFPEEIEEYSIATGSYIFNYTNYEDMYPRGLNFNLTENKIITINSTYHTVYFGLFTYDGLGLNRDWVRFYINDERKDFGRNIIQSETAVLIVLDYFNNTLANETIDASAYSEYNIFVEIYSLIILNQFTYEDIIVNITQVGSGVWMTQIIPKQFGLTYRFLPNVEYNITIYFTNATLYDSRIVNLTTNSHIESFGVPTLPEEYPKDVYFGVYTTTGLGIDRDLLRFYIDGDRTDFGFNRITDEITNITVKDYFNTTMFTQLVNFSGIYEYNILITLYSLKIKNEAELTANYTLKLGGLDTTGLIIPQEIIEYQLSSNNYVFEFTNNEDNSFHTININLNENKVYIINSTYYTAYFGLFDQYNHRLDNSLFSLYLNGTRKDFGFIELSSAYYSITVYDWLNISVFDQTTYLFNYTEYNIYITVFELQIRHLATENSNFSLYETTTHNHINFSMSPDSSRFFMLSSSIYNITWTNGENMQTSYYDITLDSNYILTLSSTYRGVYFALFTYDGLGINHDLVKFYINESRKDFGFNMMASALAEIVVLDFFNTTVFNQTIDFSSLSEYNIFIEVYSLIILNQFTYDDIVVNTTQVDSGIWLNHIIPKQFALSYRFTPNMNYTINVYYVNGSLYTTRTINLTENNHIESFGVPSLPSEYPKDVYFSVYTGTGLAIDQLLLKFYIDGDRADFGFNTIENMNITITVKDFFNTTLFSQLINTSGIYEYDILITLYSLKIKNEAELIANYTLRLGGLTETGNILPEEIVEYQLSSNNYVFEFTNNEDGSFCTININLNQDRVYIINSTYYNIFFSLYDLNLHIFHPYQYEFRLNGTIQDLGLIVDLQSDDYNITVIDRFGISLFDSIITLRGLNEYRIDITLYELQIRHLARENGNLNLTEDISGNDYSFIMTPNSIKSIVVGSADYTLSWTNGETGLTTLISVALTEDRVVVLNTSYYNIYFSLFDVNLHTIDLNQYEFRLNGTIHDLGFIEDLSTDDYTITVVDRFGTSLFNSIVNLRGINEYRIGISLYELQIRHLARENGNLTLSETITHNNLSFSMSPDSLRSFILGSSTYNVTWLNNENSISTTYNVNLNSDFILTLDSSYYNIFFSLYDLNLHTFHPYQYEFRLNGTIQDLGLIEDLQTDNYNITIRDRFETYLFNSIVGLRGLNEYRIDISLYELQIRHLATENNNLTLLENVSNNSYSFIMTPDSIKYILMGSSNYTLNWTNRENNQLTSFSINLTSDMVLTLNTTYYDVYIGLYNFYGIVNKEEVKFYINNVRADFGFNTIKTESVTLTVLDYFNSTLFNQVVILEGLKEYSIFVQAYTLVVNNLYNNQSITIKITRGSITIERLIEAQGWTEFKLYPNIEYEIISYVNGTKDEEKKVELDEEYKTVSFGFYETDVPIVPRPLEADFYTLIAFIIIICVFGWVIVIAYVYMKKDRDIVPEDTRLRHKRKRKASIDKRKGFYDHT